METNIREFFARWESGFKTMQSALLASLIITSELFFNANKSFNLALIRFDLLLQEVWKVSFC